MNIIIPALLFLAVFLPVVVFAVNPIVPCSGPDCNFGSLTTLVNNIVDWFLGISVSVAAITFAIAGGKILFNPGNTTKRGEALGMFKKTIIGLLIILCAWLVIHTVIGALSSNSKSALQFLGG